MLKERHIKFKANKTNCTLVSVQRGPNGSWSATMAGFVNVGLQDGRQLTGPITVNIGKLHQVGRRKSARRRA